MSARPGQAPAILLVVAGLACQEVGASLAVLLFPRVGPLGMVMLRLVFSAILLLLLARPKLLGHSRDGWLAIVGFGLVLAVMNGLFYLALERLPLGVTKVLVADLQEDNYITVHTSTPLNVHTGHGSNHSGLSLSVLESVLNGISTL